MASADATYDGTHDGARSQYEQMGPFVYDDGTHVEVRLWPRLMGPMMGPTMGQGHSMSRWDPSHSHEAHRPHSLALSSPKAPIPMQMGPYP